MFLNLSYVPCLFADDSKAVLVLESKSDSFTLQREFDKLHGDMGLKIHAQ